MSDGKLSSINIAVDGDETEGQVITLKYKILRRTKARAKKLKKEMNGMMIVAEDGACLFQ